MSNQLSVFAEFANRASKNTHGPLENLVKSGVLVKIENLASLKVFRNSDGDCIPIRLAFVHQQMKLISMITPRNDSGAETRLSDLSRIDDKANWEIYQFTKIRDRSNSKLEIERITGYTRADVIKETPEDKGQDYVLLKFTDTDSGASRWISTKRSFTGRYFTSALNIRRNEAGVATNGYLVNISSEYADIIKRMAHDRYINCDLQAAELPYKENGWNATSVSVEVKRLNILEAHKFAKLANDPSLSNVSSHDYMQYFRDLAGKGIVKKLFWTYGVKEISESHEHQVILINHRLKTFFTTRTLDPFTYRRNFIRRCRGIAQQDTANSSLSEIIKSTLPQDWELLAVSLSVHQPLEQKEISGQTGLITVNRTFRSRIPRTEVILFEVKSNESGLSRWTTGGVSTPDKVAVSTTRARAKKIGFSRKSKIKHLCGENDVLDRFSKQSSKDFTVIRHSEHPSIHGRPQTEHQGIVRDLNLRSLKEYLNITD